ncbi:MAG: hypothetical protein OHK006_12940 [Thermodesulfovibrionales bacterium]
MKLGWIKTEHELGKPRWHYVDLVKKHGSRFASLCGQLMVYMADDAETRHILQAGNCLRCAVILRAKGGE